MAKKLANRRRNTLTPESLSPEQRWTVIDANSKRQLYMESALGIDQTEAQRLASTLAVATEVVPRLAIDRFGYYRPELRAAAEEQIAAAAEE